MLADKIKDLLKLKVELRKNKPTVAFSVLIKIQSVRYTDDWIVGINGPYAFVIKIKVEIDDFLTNRLELKLS